MKFLRSLIAAALAAAIILPAITFLVILPAHRDFIIQITEERLVTVANHMADTIHMDSPLMGGHILQADDIAELEKYRRVVNLWKIKIFSPDGVIVHSTDAEEIGNLTGKGFFPELLAKGVALSLITDKEQVLPTREVRSRQVIETYVPIRAHGQTMGVFEVYYDITDLFDRLRRITHTSYAIVLSVFACLLVMLLLSVRQTRKSLDRQRQLEEEQKILEARVIQIKKLESLATFVGGIAHDFNNLLTAALANVGMAKRAAQKPEAAATLLEDATGNLGGIKVLIQRLQKLASPGQLNREPVAVAGLIETSLQLLPAAQTRFDQLLPQDLWPVSADRSLLTQVLQATIQNAAQAMENAGQITLSARNLTLPDRDHPGLPLPAGRYVLISIADTGPGIAGEHLEHLFDPYFTTQEKSSRRGVGLGLAFCHAVVLQHNGHIAAESRPGQGTTFSIYLPAA